MKTVNDLYRWVYEHHGEVIADELMANWDGPTEALNLALLLGTGFSWLGTGKFQQWEGIHDSLQVKTAYDFRCGEGDNRCNCENPPECRHGAVYKEVHHIVYPGWEYQPLFDYLSDAHDLSLTKDEMDEILSAASKVMDRQIATLPARNAINTPIIGEIKLKIKIKTQCP